MANFVEQLYFDKISVGNRCCNQNEKTIEIMNKVSVLEDKLLEELSEENKEILFDFMDAFTELASITVADTYAIGFRQGSQFTYQALNIEEIPEQGIVKL